MKTGIKKQGAILFVFAFTISLVACSKNEVQSDAGFENGNINIAAIHISIDSFPKETLSDVEKSSLLLMREEEKLARDVYTTLYSKWGSRPFYNISASEQTHMDAVLALLKKYEIKDPVRSNAVGVFQNAGLQKLYTQLVSLGNKTNLDAFRVGATIEDLDIYDLKRLSKETDNKDILYVYGNLERGSRNHMRAFSRSILNLGSSYVPQYISQSEFDVIISSSMETGNW